MEHDYNVSHTLMSLEQYQNKFSTKTLFELNWHRSPECIQQLLISEMAYIEMYVLSLPRSLVEDSWLMAAHFTD